MEMNEAKSAAKALYLQAAALAGLEVRPDSPERLAEIVGQAYSRVPEHRKVEAAANLVTLVATTLKVAHEQKLTHLSETTVSDAQDRVCPVFPFGP
jgi:hypothetical protein